ncbi:MAG: nuclease-related domain-containing protein [Dissulfurispiraceae bacterium]|jgi:hypothetical protein
MRREKKTPFKEKPLRLPGQSLDEEMQRLLDKMDDIAFLPLVLLFLAFMEWWRWYFKVPADFKAAALFSILAILAGVYAAVRIHKLRKMRRQLRLGRDGERLVGQCLEELRVKGYRVLHDIVGEDFNIDHVVIGPTGIFTIETKTVSKPLRGESRVSFDGDKISINGMSPDRDPLIQARAQAAWVKRFLESSLGKTFPVKPAVVYVGWFVEKMPKGFDVWVLNETALPTFIVNEYAALSADDQQAITYQLCQHIRAK